MLKIDHDVIIYIGSPQVPDIYMKYYHEMIINRPAFTPSIAVCNFSRAVCKDPLIGVSSAKKTFFKALDLKS